MPTPAVAPVPASVTAGVATPAPALLLGDLEMARPLHDRGVPVTVVAARDAPSRWSRHGFGWIEDPRPDDEALLRRLRAFASGAPRRPVLYYQEDADVRFLLAHREALADVVGLVLPPSALGRALLDKAAFQRLAEARGLPVPPGRAVRPGEGAARGADVPLPVLVKPVVRDEAWITFAAGAKTVLARTRGELDDVLARLPASQPEVVLQAPVAGPETRIESHHVYVDEGGRVVAEFTGRKLRTDPPHLGFSTALTTTDAPDVRAVGRDVVDRLGLRGVAKLDFKRDGDGRLWLLEVNPRFNLWHRLGAAAGCDLPALVHADCSGAPRPDATHARPGVTWCQLPRDAVAARRAGVPLRTWLTWLADCDAVAGLTLTDPMPFLRGRLWPEVRDRVRRAGAT